MSIAKKVNFPSLRADLSSRTCSPKFASLATILGYANSSGLGTVLNSSASHSSCSASCLARVFANRAGFIPDTRVLTDSRRITIREPLYVAPPPAPCFPSTPPRLKPSRSFGAAVSVLRLLALKAWAGFALAIFRLLDSAWLSSKSSFPFALRAFNSARAF